MSGAEVLGFTHHPSVLLKSSYLFWCGTTKNVCIYIYRYIICAHMYVYEYIMLNNRKKTLLAQPKRRISEARKGTCVTYLMSVWRFRMPTMVGKVNPPTDQNWVNLSQFSNHLYKDFGGCYLTLIKTTQVKFLNTTWDTTAQHHWTQKLVVGIHIITNVVGSVRYSKFEPIPIRQDWDSLQE